MRYIPSQIKYIYHRSSLTCGSLWCIVLSSRERNRVHARKTRKRKKHQMESIQLQIEQMHEEVRGSVITLVLSLIPTALAIVLLG